MRYIRLSIWKRKGPDLVTDDVLVKPKISFKFPDSENSVNGQEPDATAVAATSVLDGLIDLLEKKSILTSEEIAAIFEERITLSKEMESKVRNPTVQVQITRTLKALAKRKIKERG